MKKLYLKLRNFFLDHNDNGQPSIQSSSMEIELETHEQHLQELNKIEKELKKLKDSSSLNNHI